MAESATRVSQLTGLVRSFRLRSTELGAKQSMRYNGNSLEVHHG